MQIQATKGHRLSRSPTPKLLQSGRRVAACLLAEARLGAGTASGARGSQRLCNAGAQCAKTLQHHRWPAQHMLACWVCVQPATGEGNSAGIMPSKGVRFEVQIVVDLWFPLSRDVCGYTLFIQGMHVQ